MVVLVVIRYFSTLKRKKFIHYLKVKTVFVYEHNTAPCVMIRVEVTSCKLVRRWDGDTAVVVSARSLQPTFPLI